MNDLEICKKIVEIEGIHYFNPGGSNPFQELVGGSPSKVTGKYNPLTDDALCFQLMVKYRITLHAHPNGGSHAVIHDGSCVTILSAVLNKSPNRAICLAIIEAHKEQRNE